MKNTMKCLIPTVLVAVIALSFALSLTGCDNGSITGGGGTGTAPTITTASLPGGTVGIAYSQTLAATGDEPITWSVESGALPTGLTLYAAGTISGTPTTANTFNFTVKATNGTGSGTKALSITIAPSGGKPADITYTVKREDDAATTTGIAFAFSASIDSLKLGTENITIGGAAEKGAATFTKSDSNWLLSPITVNAAGNVTVSINKTGIEAETKNLIVNKAGENTPTLTGITVVYTQGDTIIYPTTLFNDLKTGLVVKAQYSGGADEITLSAGEYELTGTLTIGTSTITVTYENEIADFTVIVTAAPEYWDIIWHLNGGDKGAGAYPAQIVKGEVLARPYDPTKANNTFGGWYSDSGLTTAYNFANAVTGNLNLYAKWTPPSGDSMSDAIPLIENIWADGDLPTSGDMQWFTFTATASTQYIHVGFGTLTNLYVRVYDSNGTTVGSETNLSGSTINTSRTLTNGETYYIRVRPYSSSYSGTYRIAFNTTFYPPGTTFTTLTESQWADGDLPTSGDMQWFTFTATASTQYIHVEFGKLTQLYVQVYNSGGEAVGSQAFLLSSTSSASRSLTIGQTYYIRVRPYSSYSGTYRIAFNTSTSDPSIITGMANAIPLTENIWADGDIPTTGDKQWFTFTATAATQYIHFDPGTLTTVYVDVYNSGGEAVGSQSLLLRSTSSASRSLTIGQTYYIRVRPLSSDSGTYLILFNATPYPPNTTFIPLTENQWADGFLPYSGQQWFTFTATASTQYIHFEFGTLTLQRLFVNVYDSNGEAVVGTTDLYDSTNISRSLTAEETYYIRVRPYSIANRGTYRIAFNASTTAPGQ